jgi:hypothetical protein
MFSSLHRCRARDLLQELEMRITMYFEVVDGRLVIEL